MNIHVLLEKMHQKRNAIELAISEIESYLQSTRTKSKSREILDTIKPLKRKYIRREKLPNKRGFKYKKGTHWMQRPENRAKVIQMAKERAKKRQK